MLSVQITTFSYAEKEILKGISFEVNPGEHLAILGESGSGKSTLLHIIYGLLHLEQGSLFWQDKKLLGPTHNLIPGEPFMKMVTQEYDIMPFTTVAENIATHLSRMHAKKDEQRVEQLLKVVDMVDYKTTLVKNLSGGQKQRVALAKALANEPKLLLLDEPFSSIDTFRKNKLRRNLFSYLKEQRIACITATHDSEEALSFSDTLLILKQGKVASFGPTEQVYGDISSIYEAGFFGEVNVLPAGSLSSEEVILLPHQLKYSEEKTTLSAVVMKSYFKGSHYLVQARLNDLEVYFNHSSKLKEGQHIYLKRN
ncbi:MAG: ABC transporter ATP-binding protein [Bacteroidota bacterium]